MMHRTMAAILVSLAALAVAAGAHAMSESGTPTLTGADRQRILGSLASLLEDSYIFPQIGQEAADRLRDLASSRDSREFSDPRRFAEQITSDLQEFTHDKHLVLAFDPDRVRELRAAASSNPEPESMESQRRRRERHRRNNFGFRQVEILDGNVGYLDLRFFRDTADAASTALGAMAFLSNSDAILIDLRDNQGGSASMYLLLISYFFDSDMVHLSDLINQRSKTTQQFWTLPYVPGRRLPDVDLYLLTSHRTFSAAEQFAYDLQSRERATIVGETTGGGAHMATRMVVDDGFYVLMPFAGSTNPITESDWEGIGVQPDVEVPEEDAVDTAYLMALHRLRENTDDPDWKETLSSLIRSREE